MGVGAVDWMPGDSGPFSLTYSVEWSRGVFVGSYSGSSSWVSSASFVGWRGSCALFRLGEPWRSLDFLPQVYEFCFCGLSVACASCSLDGDVLCAETTLAPVCDVLDEVLDFV